MFGNKRGQLRQGDVFIEPIEDLDMNEMEEIPRDNGRVILAYGEVTGHAHALTDDGIKLYQHKNHEDLKKKNEPYLYLVVNNDTALSHEEHPDVPITKGKYKIAHQYQYTMREVQPVLD